MMITTARLFFFGTLMIATLLSGFLSGGMNSAAASSIHKPNLVITSVSTKPNRPGAAVCTPNGRTSGAATATIVVKNIDPIADAPANQVLFSGHNYVEPLDIVRTVPALPAGGQTTITFALSECHLNGFFMVDFNEIVVESNESDNLFSITMF